MRAVGSLNCIFNTAFFVHLENSKLLSRVRLRTWLFYLVLSLVPWLNMCWWHMRAMHEFRQMHICQEGPKRQWCQFPLSAKVQYYTHSFPGKIWQWGLRRSIHIENPLAKILAWSCKSGESDRGTSLSPAAAWPSHFFVSVMLLKHLVWMQSLCHREVLCGQLKSFFLTERKIFVCRGPPPCLGHKLPACTPTAVSYIIFVGTSKQGPEPIASFGLSELRLPVAQHELLFLLSKIYGNQTQAWYCRCYAQP